MNNRYTLSIGSNSPDSQEQMMRACNWLATEFNNVVTSEIYTSAPISGIGPDYRNMVAIVSSDLDAEQMIAKGKEYERECGRTPESKILGSVVIDVDVVICNDTVIRPGEMSRPYFQQGYRLLQDHVLN